MLSASVSYNLVTYFEDVGSEAYLWAVNLPVNVLSLDFTRGDSLGLLKKHGFPKDKVTMVLGLTGARDPSCVGTRPLQ